MYQPGDFAFLFHGGVGEMRSEKSSTVGLDTPVRSLSLECTDDLLSGA